MITGNKFRVPAPRLRLPDLGVFLSKLVKAILLWGFHGRALAEQCLAWFLHTSFSVHVWCMFSFRVCPIFAHAVTA